MASRLPQHDTLPERPVDWISIPLGVGQEPNAYGGDGSFQFTYEGSPRLQTDVRRNPDETFSYISRPPERP